MNLRHLRAWLMIRNFNFDPEAKKEELKALVKPYFISPRVLNTKSPSQWTDKQLTAWLYSRGCDEEEVEKLQEGDHNALAEEVERLMLENRPIGALETESREQCGHILQNMFLSFNSYHSSLVSGDEHGERARNRSEGKAMLFLSHSISLLTILDGESTAEAILFKKPTMYGTLRIATHFSSIFELNSLDEGGENGEGYVKKMRRYLTHGLKGNWPRHLQRKMHRGSGLHHLTWCIEQLCSGQADFQEDDPIVDRDAPIDTQEVRAYMDVDTLKEDIEDGSCLSLAVYANKQGVQHVGAIAKTSRHTCVFYKMVPSPVLTEPHGYSYFELTTDWQNPIEITDRECLAISGFHRYTAPALGLPVERTEDRVSWVYAIVIPDGRVMSEVSRGCLVFRN